MKKVDVPNFTLDVKTLNNSAFYPGCGNDFDLIWNPPNRKWNPSPGAEIEKSPGAEIENWVLCDWPAWEQEQDGVLFDVDNVNLEKVFRMEVKEKGFQIKGKPRDYTEDFNKSFKDFEQSDNPPSYISKEDGYPYLQKQKKVLFYEIKNSKGKKKNIWLLLGYEGLTLYRSIYCDSSSECELYVSSECELYVRKQGVGTKGSQNYEPEASKYLLANFIMKAPKTLAEKCDGYAQKTTFESISEGRPAPPFDLTEWIEPYFEFFDGQNKEKLWRIYRF